MGSLDVDNGRLQQARADQAVYEYVNEYEYGDERAGRKSGSGMLPAGPQPLTALAIER